MEEEFPFSKSPSLEVAHITSTHQRTDYNAITKEEENKLCKQPVVSAAISPKFKVSYGFSFAVFSEHVAVPSSNNTLG